MNKEDYVSFEVAKLLKEKGYECITALAYNLRYGNLELHRESNVRLPKYLISAPTLYEAKKWLREEHNIHIRIDCWGENDWCYILYEFTKGSVHKKVDYSYQCYYNAYEDALKEGILEALKLI